MKYLLILLLIISLPCFSQDKMGYGNDPDGADSAGFGTVTTWVKPVVDECSGSVIIGGKSYDVIRVGTQCWLGKNLEYNDNGGEIKTPNYGYGYYYSRAAAIRISDLIPGWHLPTLAEYNALVSYIGAERTGAIKALTTWDNNTGTTNSTGLSFLASGYYEPNIYTDFGESAGILLYDTGSVKKMRSGSIYWSTGNSSYYYPIRLIKD